MCLPSGRLFYDNIYVLCLVHACGIIVYCYKSYTLNNSKHKIVFPFVNKACINKLLSFYEQYVRKPDFVQSMSYT